MLRMIFDRNMSENFEEHFFVYAHAYTDIGLRTQLVSMCTHT